MAWDAQVESRNPWTLAVGPAAIRRARRGPPRMFLTNTRAVPRSWFPPLKGAKVLCLASGGGQQGPLLSAAGAEVTVYDNSPKQLEQDRAVAEREGLTISLVEGDMRDLSVFPNHRFDLIVHPCSNLFVPRIRPVWNEAFRVLKPGGTLLSAFVSPVLYLFDGARMEKGNLRVRHTIPYSDERFLSRREKVRRLKLGRPLEFGHSLEDQIGGQIDAGFLLAGFYEDRWKAGPRDPLPRYIAILAATRALKPP